jgi:hypothetical protein
MKPKSQFLSIALAALCLAAILPAGRCQVLGYFTVPITAGYNFVANPLDTDDNTLASVVSPSFPPLGTAVYLWNVASQQYNAPAVYSANGWSANLSVPPGTGFVISSTNSWTLTLIGNVLVGTSTHPYPGGGKFSLLASYFPAAETLSGPNMTFPGLESENVHLYNSARKDFSDACTFFGGYGWFDPSGSAGVAGPVVGVAQSFFAQNPGANATWVQTFSGFASQPASQSGLKAIIKSLRAEGGKVTLSILNPEGASYNIQFSTDRSAWTILAANQTGTTWAGPVPGGPQGFYRLTIP